LLRELQRFVNRAGCAHHRLDVLPAGDRRPDDRRLKDNVAVEGLAKAAGDLLAKALIQL
jgi:hypothetical protein